MCMLGRGQEQDNIFSIVEKGRFFTPTKGVDTDVGEIDRPRSRAKKIVKIVLLVLAAAVFIVMGAHVITQFYQSRP